MAKHQLCRMMASHSAVVSLAKLVHSLMSDRTPSGGIYVDRVADLLTIFVHQRDPIITHAFSARIVLKGLPIFMPYNHLNVCFCSALPRAQELPPVAAAQVYEDSARAFGRECAGRPGTRRRDPAACVHSRLPGGPLCCRACPIHCFASTDPSRRKSGTKFSERCSICAASARLARRRLRCRALFRT